MVARCQLEVTTLRREYNNVSRTSRAFHQDAHKTSLVSYLIRANSDRFLAQLDGPVATKRKDGIFWWLNSILSGNYPQMHRASLKWPDYVSVDLAAFNMTASYLSEIRIQITLFISIN